MTALTISPRRGLRPAMLLAASIGVIVVSQVGASLSRAPQVARVPAATEQPQRVDSAGGPSAGTPRDLANIDRSIRAWTANLAANDRDFLSATNLGLLYDARARLTGDIGDYTRATEALNRALAIEPAHLPARLLHARELAATHDFSGALDEARAINRETAGQPQALATIGDASLELGDINAAEDAYRALEQLAPGAAVTARLARVAFVRGDTAGALSLAARAFDEATADGETGPAASWYTYLCGTMSMAAGAPATALDWFAQALEQWPESFLALAGRARALAALGQTEEAIAGYRAAIAVAPQPDALTALGDLYALRGDGVSANEQYDTVELIAQLASINQQVHNRQLALFWLNHDRHPAEALTLAQAELKTRKDIYGWDTYAWALLANDRVAEADQAEQNALALDTHDALLDYHAGVIAAAAGDSNRARVALEAALALPGALDPLALSRAQAALAALQ